jgi:hypothetical protein
LVLALFSFAAPGGAAAGDKRAAEPDPRALAADLASTRGPRHLPIIRIANEGERARFLWPSLVTILESGMPSEQVCAAWALGWIGASEAVPALGKALGSRDWQVVFAAAGTLGNFGAAAKDVLATLRDVAQHHWMSAVRQRASAAMTSIEHPERAPLPGPHHKDPLGWEGDFWQFREGAFWDFSGDPCGLSTAVEVNIGERWMAVPRRHSGPDERGRLPSSILRRLKLEEWQQVTGALSVAGGWLVGIDGGEWGGGLRFVASSGKAQVLWSRNIIRLVRSGSGMFASAEASWAAAKRSGREVLSVARDDRNRWHADRLAALPGPEKMMVPLEEGQVLFLGQFGAISVRSDGSMREEACPERDSEAVAATKLDAKADRPRASVPSFAYGDRVEDAVAVLTQVLNHPRVLPFFHLDRAAYARIEALPSPLRDRPMQIGDLEISWAASPAPEVFRFLELSFDSATVAAVSFEYRSQGMEGYAMVEKQESGWRVVGMTIVEKEP